MRKLKKLAALLLIAVVFAGSLFGCAAKQKDSDTKELEGEANTPTVSEEKSEGITLSMYIVTSWDTDALDKGISMYEEATGNKIEREVIPDDQAKDLLRIRLATNTDVPDIVAVDGSLGTSEQMMQYFEVLDGEWISQLIPEHLENEYKMPDGNVYVAPYGSCSVLGLIYNKSVMKENGIELPIKTYSEFLAACETLKAAGVTPLSISNKEGWTAQILGLDQRFSRFTEEDYVALKSGKLKYTDIPSMKVLFENMVGLKDKGYINEDYMSTTMDMSLEDVATGECAMTPAGDWSHSVVQNNFPDLADNVGMIPVPIMEDSIYINIGVASKGFRITKDGKSGNVEAAKEFADFMVSKDTMKAMYDIEPGLSPFVGLDVEKNSWDDEMVGYTASIPYAKLEKWNGFNAGDFATNVQLLFGGSSVEDALEAWYSDCSLINKAAGTPGF